MVDTHLAYAGWQFVLLEPFPNSDWKLKIDGQPEPLAEARVFSRYLHDLEVWDDHEPARLLAGFRKLQFPQQSKAFVVPDLNRYAAGQTVYLICAAPDVSQQLVLQVSQQEQVHLELDLAPSPTGLIVQWLRDFPPGEYQVRLYSSRGQYQSGCSFVIGPPDDVVPSDPVPLLAASGPLPDNAERVRLPMHGYELEHWFSWDDRTEGFRILPADVVLGPLLQRTETGIVTGASLVVVCRPGGEGISLCDVEQWEAFAHSRLCAEQLNGGELLEYELCSRPDAPAESPSAEDAPSESFDPWAAPPPACPRFHGPGSDLQLCRWNEGILPLEGPCLVRAYHVLDGRVGCSTLQLD